MSKRSNYKSPAGSPFSLTTSEVNILPINQDRQVVYLFNAGANPARIAFVAGENDYIEIPSLDGLKLSDPAPINALYAKSSTGTTTLHVIEG